MKKKVIAVFTGNRAEYGLQFPILKAIDEHPDLEYRLIVSGAHLDKNFGDTLKKVISDVTLYDSLVKKGNTYVKKYFSNHGKAAFNLLNYVKNIEQV